MEEFANLIRSLLSADDHVRVPSEEAYKQMESENPIHCLGNLLSILISDQFTDITVNCFIYLYRITSLFSSQDKFAEIPPEIMEMLKQVLIRFIQTPIEQNRVAVNHAYLILQQFVVFFTKIQPFPELIQIIQQQINTTNQALAISYLGYYVSVFIHTQSAEEIFNEFCPLLLSNFTSTESISEQIHLFLQLTSLTPEVFAHSERIAELFALLVASPKPTDYSFKNAIRYFKESVKLMSEEYIGYCSPIFAVLFSIISSETANDAQKLELFDSLEEMSRFYGVSDLILQNIENLSENCIQLVSRCSETESELFENANSFLATLAEDTDFKSQFTEYSQQFLESDNPYILSTVLRVMSPPDAVETLIQLMKHESELISENSLISIETVLRNHFKEVTQLNESTMVEIFNELSSVIERNSECVVRAMGPLFDGAASYSCKNFIIEVAPNIIELLGSIFNFASVHLAAAMAMACPSEMSEAAVQISSQILAVIAEETTHNDGIEILSLEGNFLRCMDDANKVDFMQNLLSLVPNWPDIVSCRGLGFCIKALGPLNNNFIDALMPLLIESCSKDISIGVDFNITNHDSISSFAIPGTSKNIIIRSEEVNDIIYSLFNLRKFVNATGQNIINYNEQFNEVVGKTLFQLLDMNIRINSFKLISSLCKAFPNSAHQYMGPISTFLFGSNQEEDESVAEPENEVRRICLQKIAKLIENQKIPMSFVAAAAEIPPRMIQLCASEIVNEIRGNTFTENVYNEFQDTLWEVLVIMKNMEVRDHEIASKAFGQCIAVIDQAALSEQTPLLEVIRAGLVADFLENVPEFPGFEGAFAMIINGMQSLHPDTRKLSLFGFGRIIAKINVDVANYDNYLSLLMNVLSNESTKENDDYAMGDECGLSSFCLILKKRIALTPQGSEVYFQFIANSLPIYRDEDEATIVYTFLYECMYNTRLSTEIRQFMSSLINSCAGHELSSSIVIALIEKLKSQ